MDDAQAAAGTGKEYASYELDAHGLKVKVRIIDKGDFAPIYEVTTPGPRGGNQGADDLAQAVAPLDGADRPVQDRGQGVRRRAHAQVRGRLRDSHREVPAGLIGGDEEGAHSLRDKRHARPRRPGGAARRREPRGDRGQHLQGARVGVPQEVRLVQDEHHR